MVCRRNAIWTIRGEASRSEGRQDCCAPDSGCRSPQKFQPELNLPGGGGGGRDDPGSRGWPSGCRCVHNWIRYVEVRVIEQIEYLGAELQAQSLGK